MINISNLHFAYPNSSFTLEIDDLKIPSGKAIAIIGPSGTGKTTLLNLIAGVFQPQSGQVTTSSAALSSMSDAQRRNFRMQNVGMIFQEFELLEYLNVRDNILLPYRMSSALELKNDTLERMEKLAKQIGIADKLKRPVKKLSQGEKQRVALCRAVLPDPPLLLADEPTGNLDPENTQCVLDILFEHVRSVKATLVVVTHERHYLERFDQVIDFEKFRKVSPNA